MTNSTHHTGTANRLIGEKSPYLLQHAYNPVDWYPWGEEAIERARREDKPIFLSIGYSTCYWCHVMEREVFENESLAALMNRHVVSIKVDREERPDIDRIYMNALMAMTGSGGWPMSMFLTPDLVPFFGATYIPPETAFGRAGFRDVLTRIHEVWTHEREHLREVSERIRGFLAESSSPEAGQAIPGLETLDACFRYHEQRYDKQFAGFSGAPKFPKPVSVNALLRYHARTGNADARSMALETLRRMAHGGIYDHLGGGFHRYATDERWHVPHFEKMLYDQAQLAVSYLEAYQMTGDPFFEYVTREILSYVGRVMTAPEGGFTSAEDAESVPASADPENPPKKKEGAFYTWTYGEMADVLSPEELKAVAVLYDVKPEGNVLADPHGEFRNLNILHLPRPVRDAAERLGIGKQGLKDVMEEARNKLFHRREQRPKPHLDDKVLVSWNGLMISAFARAHQVLGEQRYGEVAARAAEFLLGTMYSSGARRLLRRYRAEEARYEAHLQDFAFLIQGLLDLYEATFEIRWLKTALELTDLMIERFADPADGGFFDTSGDDPTILVRTKEWQDGAEPSGNAVALMNLLRLAEMVRRDDYRRLAEQSLRYFGDVLTRAPYAAPQLLTALELSLSKPRQIIVAGPREDEHTRAILATVHRSFIPNKILLLADGAEGQQFLASFVPFLETVRMVGETPTAYICENYACELPTSDLNEIRRLLDAPSRL